MGETEELEKQKSALYAFLIPWTIMIPLGFTSFEMLFSWTPTTSRENAIITPGNSNHTYENIILLTHELNADAMPVEVSDMKAKVKSGWV